MSSSIILKADIYSVASRPKMRELFMQCKRYCSLIFTELKWLYPLNPYWNSALDLLRGKAYNNPPPKDPM